MIFYEATVTEDEIKRLVEEYKSRGIEYNEHNIRLLMESEVWRNDIYQVQVRGRGCGIIHLSIKRVDREPIHDWRDLQAIKNTLVGEENEAIELYPAESRRVDSANQYHLWVFEDPTFRVPLGFNERLVKEDTDGTRAKQRRFNE